MDKQKKLSKPKFVVLTRSLNFKGNVLTERREVHVVEERKGKRKVLALIRRTINDLAVTSQLIETEEFKELKHSSQQLDKEERRKFVSDWASMWRPTIPYDRNKMTQSMLVAADIEPYEDLPEYKKAKEALKVKGKKEKEKKEKKKKEKKKKDRDSRTEEDEADRETEKDREKDTKSKKEQDGIAIIEENRTTVITKEKKVVKEKNDKDKEVETEEEEEEIEIEEEEIKDETEEEEKEPSETEEEEDRNIDETEDEQKEDESREETGDEEEEKENGNETEEEEEEDINIDETEDEDIRDETEEDKEETGDETEEEEKLPSLDTKFGVLYQALTFHIKKRDEALSTKIAQAIQQNEDQSNMKIERALADFKTAMTTSSQEPEYPNPSSISSSTQKVPKAPWKEAGPEYGWKADFLE